MMTDPPPTTRNHDDWIDPAAAALAIDDPGPRRPMSTLPTGPRAMARGLVFVGAAVVELLTLVWLCVCLVLSCVGIGLPMLPAAFAAVRADARRQRMLAGKLSGIPVHAQYVPFAEGKGPFGLATMVRRLSDPTSLRDLAWHVLNPGIGSTIGLLPAAMVLHGVWGVWLALNHGADPQFWVDSWYALIPLRSDSAFVAVGVWGAAEIVIAPFVARPLVRLHGLWVRAMLSTDDVDALRARIGRLQQTRSAALGDQHAEIKRIERDLHDGAQSRLVAMGMTLTQASRLLETDPDRAAALLRTATEESQTVLQELRDLVRGIRPPVLADRGLVEAIRGLAASTPVPTEVASTLRRPLPAPLETALYFAVAELITNAVKHSDTDRIEVSLAEAGDLVVVHVEDRGRGGAEAATGGGIDGVRRRLVPFDGELVVDSPVGGPTSAVIRVPRTSL